MTSTRPVFVLLSFVIVSAASCVGSGGGTGEPPASDSGTPSDASSVPDVETDAGSAPECSPGSRACQGNVPRTCSGAGKWEEQAPCAGTLPVCQGGQCVGRSCEGLTQTSNGRSSCAYGEVPASSFPMGRSTSGADMAVVTAPSELPEHPASVQAHALDVFEVTVARFRKFVEAYPTSKPANDAGAHPRIPFSGWKSGWDANLPTDRAALEAELACADPNAAAQWSTAPGMRESAPINCVSWYLAFAFCAWDGGRLPLEVEWENAAAGGDENRLYPWGGSTADATRAIFACGSPESTCGIDTLRPVGSVPAGAGRYGHHDLAGNVQEWIYDGFDATFYSGAGNPCNTCANAPTTENSIRGGGFTSFAPVYLRAAQRGKFVATLRRTDIGVRCARDP